jgi:hypothetical protein
MSASPGRRIYDLSTDRALGRLRREVVSALGVLIVAFNLFAGMLVASTSAAGLAPYLEESFGERIVICTGAGMIVLDAEGNPVRRDDGIDAVCAFCLPMVGGIADGPPLVALLDAPAMVEPALPGPDTAVAFAAPARVAGATSPRGPPLA